LPVNHALDVLVSVQRGKDAIMFTVGKLVEGGFLFPCSICGWKTKWRVITDPCGTTDSMCLKCHMKKKGMNENRDKKTQLKKTCDCINRMGDIVKAWKTFKFCPYCGKRKAVKR
jgi:hypothetical protein